MTLCIELIGIAILIVWLIIPVREFKGILTRLRKRDEEAGR